MLSKYLLTVYLYDDAPLHMLDMFVQVNELLKQDIKMSCGKLSKNTVEDYCTDKGIESTQLIKVVRDDFVHEIRNVPQLYEDLLAVTTSIVQSHLKYFGIEAGDEYVTNELEKTYDLLQMLLNMEGVV